MRLSCFYGQLVKEENVSVMEKDSFSSLLDKIENGTAVIFLFKARILELNAVRVKFKHYGNLPLRDDATRLLQYAGECLRESVKIYLATNIDSVSLADMISNPSIRERIKEAEKHLEQGDFVQSIGKCAVADLLISKPLDVLMPRIDQFGIRAVRTHFRGEELRSIGSIFDYFAKYIESLRAVALAGLINLEGRDYFKYKQLIPVVYQTMNGDLKVQHKKHSYTKEEVLFCLKHVTEVGL